MRKFGGHPGEERLSCSVSFETLLMKDLPHRGRVLIHGACPDCLGLIIVNRPESLDVLRHVFLENATRTLQLSEHKMGYFLTRTAHRSVNHTHCLEPSCIHWDWACPKGEREDLGYQVLDLSVLHLCLGITCFLESFMKG